jgi:hypothetical protein
MSAPEKATIRGERKATFVLAKTGVYSCARCGRALRAGNRITITRESRDLVSVRHAGRWCPPAPPRV